MESDSPNSDMGYELADGGVIEFPDPLSGDITRRDIHGNTEECRACDDGDWQEWYDLFNDAPAVLRFFCGQEVIVTDGDRSWKGVIEDINEDQRTAAVLPGLNSNDNEATWVPMDQLKPK